MKRTEKVAPLSIWFPLATAALGILPFCVDFPSGLLNWDDDRNFVTNPAFRLPLVDFTAWAFTHGWLAVYQPLAWLALRAELTLAGFFSLAPATGLRLGSLALHGAVVYWLVRTLEDLIGRAPRTRLAITLATLWFAVHPLRTEVVAWASCQPYLLAALGALLAFRAARAKAFRRAALWYAAAILAKVVAIPAMLALIWAARGSRRFSLALVSLAVLAASANFAVREWHGEASLPASDPALSRGRALIAAPAIAIETAAVPLAPSPLYPLPRDLALAWQAILLALVATALVAFRRSAKSRGAGNFWAAIAIGAFCFLPGLAAALSERIAFADRYAYLPALAFAAALAVALTETKIPLGWAALIVAALAGRTLVTVPRWHDSETLWTYALTTDAARSAKAHANLFAARMDRGHADAACAGVPAALAIDATVPELQNAAGLCALQRQDFAAATAAFREAIRRRAGYAEAHSNLAYIYDSAGQPAEALTELEIAIQWDPREPKVHELRARVLAHLGRPADALADWRIVIDANPRDAESYRLYGRALAEARFYAESREVLRRAIALDPRNAQARADLASVERVLAPAQ